MSDEPSIQAKHDYCIAWEKSGLAKGVFCAGHDISRAEFASWYQQYKKGLFNESSFLPMTVSAKSSTEVAPEVIPFEISLPNQARIVMAMPKQAFVSFIQELCHATSTVW